MSIHVGFDHASGNLYASKEDEIDQIEIYCDACADYDDYLGEFDNVDELKMYCKKNSFYSYPDEYLENLFKEAQNE